jgi:hypothetical protein
MVGRENVIVIINSSDLIACKKKDNRHDDENEVCSQLFTPESLNTICSQSKRISKPLLIIWHVRFPGKS